jgi:hypothetical protein
MGAVVFILINGPAAILFRGSRTFSRRLLGLASTVSHWRDLGRCQGSDDFATRRLTATQRATDSPCSTTLSRRAMLIALLRTIEAA